MKQISVLYLEDNTEFGRNTKILLDHEGFCVELARNTEKAREAFRNKRPDLLLVDIQLQEETNGLDFIREIKETDPWFPIVVYSSYADPQTIIATNKLEALTHIDKNEDIEVLVAKLQNIARQALHLGKKHNPGLILSPFTVFNPLTGVLIIKDVRLKLNNKDSAMLNCLGRHLNEWVSPHELCLSLWKVEKEVEHLKRYAWHLRKYLASDPTLTLQNRHGGFYKLESPNIS